MLTIESLQASLQEDAKRQTTKRYFAALLC